MRLLPVVLRPVPGEALVSWLHRIAAIYGIELRDFLNIPAAQMRDLALWPEDGAMQAICAATRIRPQLAHRHTFRGYFRTWPEHWATRSAAFDRRYDDPAPWIQVCVRCLQEDGAQGFQFLRLGWLSAAATFCQRHGEPLLDDCPQCARAVTPKCRRRARLTYFVCAFCDEIQAGFRSEGPMGCYEVAVQWMLRFERALAGALDGNQVDPIWAGPCSPEAFVHLVEDLVWALTRPSRVHPDRSPIEWFAVNGFPHGRQFPEIAIAYRLSRTTVRRRRALLATTACLLMGPHFRSRMENSPRHRSSRSELIALADNLPDFLREQFFYRARRWPPLPRALLNGARSVH